MQTHYAEPRQPVSGQGPELLAITTTSEPTAAAFIDRAISELAGARVAVLTNETPVIGAPLLAFAPGSGDVLRYTRPDDMVALCTPDGASGLVVDRDTFSDHRPPMWTVIGWAGPGLSHDALPHPSLTADDVENGTTAFRAWQHRA